MLRKGGLYLLMGRGVPDSFLPFQEYYNLRKGYDLKTYGNL